MNIQLDELKALFAAMQSSDISEFEYEDEQTRIKVGRGTGRVVTEVVHAAPQHGANFHSVAPYAGVSQTGPASSPPPSMPPQSAPAQEDGSIHYLTSPFVGTFYRSPSPDAPSFVNNGSSVREGQTLCIVEAMKLMNEIEADVAGTIVDCLAENGKPVEFGQKLFKIRKA